MPTSAWNEDPRTYQKQERARIFRLFTALFIVAPIVVESGLLIANGKPAPTFAPGLACVLFHASNYLAYRVHQRLVVGATLAVVGFSLIITGAVVHHGGIDSPSLPLLSVAMIFAAVTVGKRMAFNILAYGIAVCVCGVLIQPEETVRGVIFIASLVITKSLIYQFLREQAQVEARHDDMFEIIERSQDFIVTRTGDELTYGNPAFVAATGVDPQRQCVTIRDIHPEYVLFTQQQVYERLGALKTWTGESVLLGMNGEEIPVLQTLSLHRRDGPYRASDSSTMKNISVLKAHEEKLWESMQDLKKALKVRSQFLANMSHEIRTPLNGLLGTAQLLEPYVSGAEGRDYLEIILKSGDHLASVINDILDLSKLEARQVVLDKVTFNPVSVALQAHKLFSARALETKNQWILEPKITEDLWIIGDECRYRQVLYNLISNALKFTQEGIINLRVEVRRASEGQAVVMTSVSDTGIGIAPEQQKKIFYPFEQEDNSTARRFGGTGLGLSISRHIVELFGAELKLESAPGEGTLFSFEYTAALTEPPATRSPELETSLRLRVIVAEDNVVNRKVIGGMLKRLSIVPQFANDGLELLSQLKEREYDVILMDCHMPNLDGYEATRRIVSEYKPHERPRIIALTASAMKDDEQRCYEVGMDDFLSKPVKLQALSQALARVKQC